MSKTKQTKSRRCAVRAGSAPSGFRWVKRGEWLQTTDSYRVEDYVTGEVSWKRHDDPFRWKPRKCTTSWNYIRNVKPNAGDVARAGNGAAPKQANSL